MNTKAIDLVREYDTKQRRSELALVEKILANDLFGFRLAEGDGNIYWQRQFRNRFEDIAHSLENSGDPDFVVLAKMYKLKLNQLNTSRKKAYELNRAYWIGA